MWSQSSKKQAQFADQDVDLPRASEGDALETDSAAEGSNHDRGSGGSTSNEGASTNRDDVACELTKLAGNDNRNVRIWKFMVVTIIAVAGALVSTGIYYYLKFQEDEEIKDNVSIVLFLCKHLLIRFNLVESNTCPMRYSAVHLVCQHYRRRFKNRIQVNFGCWQRTQFDCYH